MHKIERGQAGYINYKKKTEIIKTVLLFAIPLALFAAGLLATKSRLNLLTIVAVLGMLPASKSAVSMIMYLKSHSISKDTYDAVASYAQPLTGAFDNVFTTYEKTYEVPSLVIRSGNVCGLTAQKYPTVSALEKHLTDCIKKEGYHVNVKMFDSVDAYRTRLESLARLEESQPDKDAAVLHILFEVSL